MPVNRLTDKDVVILKMKYYSAMRKKKILPFVTTCLDSEDITPTKISQRKTNTVGYHLYVDLKERQTHKNRVKWWLPGSGGRGNSRDVVKDTNLQLVDT